MRWNLFCDSPYKLFAFFTLNLIYFKLHSGLISPPAPFKYQSNIWLNCFKELTVFDHVLSDVMEWHFFSWPIKPLDLLLEFHRVKAPSPICCFLSLRFWCLISSYYRHNYLHLACVLRKCSVCVFTSSLQALIFSFLFPSPLNSLYRSQRQTTWRNRMSTSCCPPTHWWRICSGLWGLQKCSHFLD